MSDTDDTLTFALKENLESSMNRTCFWNVEGNLTHARGEHVAPEIQNPEPPNSEADVRI